MILKMLKNFFVESPDKKLGEFRDLVTAINSREDVVSKYSEADFAATSNEYRARIAKGEPLDAILPDVFAMVREASKRTVNMRHFDVQLLGGIALHKGYIAEMKTGEGKTLVATLPIVLNALEGKGSHLVTVNDYLARRDSEWMGPIYRYMGLSVGTIQNSLNPEQRRIAYGSDITYGTNNEFGFDYLRDNMAVATDQLVQRELHYAIVDEVDSILIDEARTPLIISGMMDEDVTGYQKADRVARSLQNERDFKTDEKTKNVTMTEEGIKRAEELLHIGSLYDIAHMDTAHQINQALRAIHMYKLDVDYVIKDGEIIIVDEFTGRLMVGRRYSDGLHQAIEAKEKVEIRQESQTLATITFQNFFRMYTKLAGMTGTAMTEEAEFSKIYNLDVLPIPTHRPMVRKDLNDHVYKSQKEKFRAVIKEIVECHKKQQPVLVGTASIEHSEKLSDLLRREGVTHEVLNAKQHEREAHIIAQAGQPGAVTIATNMAGRGTDIVLGDGVPALGGLHVIGTERHESRRIDNQLRGRSGRQGDPGSSRFYVGLDDDLMRLFGGQRVAGMMERLGVEEDVPIEHSWITRSIETAQKRVEEHHFAIRKQLLEYDDVMNRQRSTIYTLRRRMLEGKDISEKFIEFLKEVIDDELGSIEWPKGGPDEEAHKELISRLEQTLTISLSGIQAETREAAVDQIFARAKEGLIQKEAEIGSDIFPAAIRMVALRNIDQKWIEHLHELDSLKEGIGLRAYGQLDPLIEYKREGFALFESMMKSISHDTVNFFFRLETRREESDAPPVQAAAVLKTPKRVQLGAPKTETAEPVHRTHEKIGRNDPCYCGSRKKFKKCHGAS